MSELPHPPSPPKPRLAKVLVCVDQWSQDAFSGTFYHLFLPDAFPFTDRVDLILKMDRLFDELNHPQSQFRPRDIPPRKRGEGPAGPHSHTILKEGIRNRRPGRCATFFIQVLYRQNATWQGELMALDETAPVCFRSVLELLRLMEAGHVKRNQAKTEEGTAAGSIG